MGNKSTKSTQKSNEVVKLEQAVAEAEAELNSKSEPQIKKQASPSKDDSNSEEPTSDNKEKSSKKSPKKSKITKSTAPIASSFKPSSAAQLTPTAIDLTPAKSTTKSSSAPKTRKIKIETPGDNIVVSRSSSNANQLKLPVVRKLHFKLSHIISAILIILLIAFIARVAIWEHDYLNRMEGSERDVVTMVEVDEGEEVDEERPTETEVAEYVVAPDKPRYFSIPSLGIYNARIVEIGLKNSGEIATPYNIYDVGWYQNSSLPGTNGVSIMDGHGGGPGIGIFGSLPKISVGAEILVEMGDGRQFKYIVADTATKALGDEANEYMSEVFTSPQTGTESLSLITCTGDYWLASRTYSHRFFLRALLAE